MSTLPNGSKDERLARIDSFDFRTIHPNLRFGTTSDRYAGWIGQIYPESYGGRVSRRTRQLGGKSYEERTVPIDSVVDYFQHFRVLEIDYTYYRPLIEEDGSPSSNLGVLQRYMDHAPADAKFLLKVPNLFFSRRLMRRSQGKTVSQSNPEYLNLQRYIEQFHAPAVETTGIKLAGLLFEQEYQRKGDSPSPEANVEELDRFFSGVPRDAPLHLEVRSPHLLDQSYFDWLETCGLGYVFSHWTWLPPLRKQWKMAEARFTESRGEAMLRLLTPLRVPYAQAYARTHPFDRVVPEIAESKEAERMKLDSVALAMAAIRSGGTLNILANNRAWGNAPELSKAIASRLIEELDNASSTPDSPSVDHDLP